MTSAIRVECAEETPSTAMMEETSDEWPMVGLPRERAAQDSPPPSAQRLDEGKQLPVVYRPVAFRGRESLAEVCRRL